MLPRIIISVYFIASVLTFIAYVLDKSAAKSNRRRICIFAG